MDKLQTQQKMLSSWKSIMEVLQKEMITAEDFTKAFAIVVNLIKELKSSNMREFGSMKSEMSAMSNKLISDFESVIKDTRQANETTFQKIKERSMESIDAMFRKMDVQGKMDAMMKECEAKMPDTEKMMAEMLAKVPETTPEQVRDKLETLQGNERLDSSAIKGLEDMVKKLEERITSIPRGGGRVSRNNIYQTLTPDGSNKTFSVPKNTGGVVIGSDFPTVLMEGAGFTVNASRNQITLTVENAPSLGSQLVFIGQGIFNV